MRQTPLKTYVLTALIEDGAYIPDLWAKAEKALRREVPVRTFYDAIYRLRDDGLINYRSRHLSDEQWDSMLAELSDGPVAANIPDDPEIGLVRLTTRGRVHAELLSLQDLIPAPRQREAARRIHRLQDLIGAVVNSGGDS